MQNGYEAVESKTIKEMAEYLTLNNIAPEDIIYLTKSDSVLGSDRVSAIIHYVERVAPEHGVYGRG